MVISMLIFQINPSVLENWWCWGLGGLSPRSSIWEKIVKLRSEVNEIETKKMIRRINTLKSQFFEDILSNLSYSLVQYL